MLFGPRQAFPLLIGVTKAEVTDRFDVTIKDSGERLVLKAIPKHQADNDRYCEIDVILNKTTFLTVATQVFSPNGKDHFVYELSEPKINQQPSDHDKLMAPDLFGFSVAVNPPPPKCPPVSPKPLPSSRR